MTHCSIGQSLAAGAAERGTARLAHVTFLCCRAALSFKKVTKGVRIFVPPSLSLIVENLTLRVFGIMISENLGSIS